MFRQHWPPLSLASYHNPSVATYALGLGIAALAGF